MNTLPWVHRVFLAGVGLLASDRLPDPSSHIVYRLNGLRHWSGSPRLPCTHPEYTLSGTYRIKDSGWYTHGIVGTSWVLTTGPENPNLRSSPTGQNKVSLFIGNPRMRSPSQSAHGQRHHHRHLPTYPHHTCYYDLYQLDVWVGTI